VFHSFQKTRQKSSDVGSGDLQWDQHHEPFEYWAKLSKVQQQSVLELVRMRAAKNEEQWGKLGTLRLKLDSLNED
jgi:hypothetical protein